MKPSNHIPAYVLFFLSFLEGGSVMLTELTGARVLAPVFGTSLYVWSAVMGITLLGLACGYFYGGKLSTKNNPEKKLLHVLCASAIFMMLMPVLNHFMNIFAFHLDLLPAVSVSSLLVLFPPLFFMGMVSPLVIHCLISEKKGGGKRSGEVYAVSTAGGILFTFLTGFWLLPQFGTHTPVLAAGIALILIPIIYLIKFKSYLNAIILIALSAFLLYTGIVNTQKKKYVLYESEGIFGKLEVVDYETRDLKTKKLQHPRYLLVNNIIQSSIDLYDKDLFADYTGTVDSNVCENGKGKKALVMGLGAGTVANLFKKKDYGVTAIEIDKRIYEVSKKYFFLDKGVDVKIDDARHHINVMKETYHYIMIDVFKGEDPPYYVLTRESINKMKECLVDSGKIILNTYGYLSKELGKGNRALIKTFVDCGMRVELFGTGLTEDTRNIVLCATNSHLPTENSPCKKKLSSLITEKYSLKDVEVLTDDNCNLDFLNAKAALQWRSQYLRNFILPRQ